MSEAAGKVVVDLLAEGPTVEAAVAVFAARVQPAILESSLADDRYGRFSIFAADPVAAVTLDRLEAARCGLSRAPSVADRAPEVPFSGGWIGFIPYELGLPSEGMVPHPDVDIARAAHFAFYDAAAVYDHLRGCWFTVAVEWAGQRSSVTERFAGLRTLLADAAARPEPRPPAPLTTQPAPSMSRPSYLAKVERIKRFIEAGDAYEVNLTQRFTCATTATPLELYLRLRRASPSSYAAFLPWNQAAILSSSPELFLDLRDGRVLTRPIKGTRPRGGSPRADAVRRRELEQSEKDGAELNMIVDLLRNDLGRVCKYGSVQVTQPRAIEEHQTVFHQVATIQGQLAPSRNWADLLRATFPGGSVTGAPKIRAMQIIRQLEPTPRGVYCGAIGWIGLDGNATFNLAIRTMVQRRDRVSFYAGGAIVADSEPEAEYEETLVKLEGMLRALNCARPAETTTTTLREPATAA
jgi:para-aminobenzoate synthetase component 1